MLEFIETFKGVLQRLDSENISYIIVGSIAAMVYGEPRITRDMDLVIDLKSEDTEKFIKLFTQPEFYCPPIEILGDEIRNRGQFNLLHVSTGLKIDVIIKKLNDFDKGRFERRKKIEIWEGFSAWLASAEDIIIKKLEFYRDGQSEKHLIDIRGILTNSKIDMDYLNQWVSKLGLEDQRNKL